MAVKDSGGEQVDAAIVSGTCVTCGGPPQQGCGTCARRQRERRRRDALKLVEAGVPLRRVARETGVGRNTLRRALCPTAAPNSVDNSRLREAVEQAMRADPTLSLSEIARRAGYTGRATHIARLLGRIPTNRRSRDGRTYPPRFRCEISIDDAVRIARAAGLDPVDVDL